MEMRVLLVEDDPALRRLLEKGLRPEFELRICADGVEARGRLASEHFDVLLTDLELGVVSGEELADEARALPRPVGIVIMSGDLERLERSRARADAAVAKPFPMPAVRSAVRRAASRAILAWIRRDAGTHLSC
jgi:CheY-like chemotaxis protein